MSMRSYIRSGSGWNRISVVTQTTAHTHVYIRPYMLLWLMFVMLCVDGRLCNKRNPRKGNVWFLSRSIYWKLKCVAHVFRCTLMVVMKPKSTSLLYRDLARVLVTSTHAVGIPGRYMRFTIYEACTQRGMNMLLVVYFTLVLVVVLLLATDD